MLNMVQNRQLLATPYPGWPPASGSVCASLARSSAER